VTVTVIYCILSHFCYQWHRKQFESAWGPWPEREGEPVAVVWGNVIQQGSGLIRGRDHDQKAKRQSSWSWKRFTFGHPTKATKLAEITGSSI